jgi:hypothetical protein
MLSVPFLLRRSSHRFDACNEKDAQIIYDNMRAGLYQADFPNVKRALEANYQCLGISCTDVGGIWSSKEGGDMMVQYLVLTLPVLAPM